jgi:antitoxin CptB
MSGSQRSSAGLDPERRKLLFRAWHRGMREMDLILGQFADAHIGDLSEEELRIFEDLLEAPDQDMFKWIVGSLAVPEAFDTPVFARIKAFHVHMKPLHA